jgi:hypothetical protein
MKRLGDVALLKKAASDTDGGVSGPVAMSAILRHRDPSRAFLHGVQEPH